MRRLQDRCNIRGHNGAGGRANMIVVAYEERKKHLSDSEMSIRHLEHVLTPNIMNLIAVARSIDKSVAGVVVQDIRDFCVRVVYVGEYSRVG